MEKILVVEDDRELAQGICYALQKEQYHTIASSSICEAEAVFLQEGAELILLDVNLPDGEGFSFCRWVKARREIPVLFLTARDLEEDALYGYESGADDYITKPFSMKILLKKVRVNLKRTQDAVRTGFEDGFLMVDFDRARVEAGGKECNITPTEFRLLRQFIENKGQRRPICG